MKTKITVAAILALGCSLTFAAPAKKISSSPSSRAFFIYGEKDVFTIKEIVSKQKDENGHTSMTIKFDAAARENNTYNIVKLENNVGGCAQGKEHYAEDGTNQLWVSDSTSCTDTAEIWGGPNKGGITDLVRFTDPIGSGGYNTTGTINDIYIGNLGPDEYQGIMNYTLRRGTPPAGKDECGDVVLKVKGTSGNSETNIPLPYGENMRLEFLIGWVRPTDKVEFEMHQAKPCRGVTDPMRDIARTTGSAIIHNNPWDRKKKR